ncbi:MAG: response regulator [Desulfobacteraceae bacterium]|nr:response regulator [Desulfobacteraceae bacterium]
MNSETDNRPMASKGSMMLRNDDILIVDDEIPNLQLLAELLEKEGYLVRPAEMAQMAIDSALAKPPRLILLDVRMPEMDGFEVCRRLKQDKGTRDIPIIFVSTLQDTEDRVRGFEAGGVDFITKPFQTQEVLARVRTHMQLHRMQLDLEQKVQERSAELSKVNEELQKKEFHFRNLVESARAVPWELDLDTWCFTYVGRQAVKLLGYPLESWYEKNFWVEHLHPDDRELAVRFCQEETAKGEEHEFECRMIADDGRTVWIRHYVSVATDESGKTFLGGLMYDITKLKRAEREVRDQRDVLSRVERTTSMGQLTGSIAHELNQPLTGILSNAQSAEIMIKKSPSGYDDLTVIMADIVADTKRAGDIIRNLQELYRKQEGEFLPVDINTVVDETTQLLRSEFVMKHIVLTTECSPSIPMVDGNRIQIQQIFVNLIMNAIQAMSDTARDDRRLHIATAYDANEVKGWVEDCGPGIYACKTDHIFEPLATWKPGGTGMGLAISNSIIEAHGGRMWAENRLEGGARVGFALLVPKEGRQA